ARPLPQLKAKVPGLLGVVGRTHIQDIDRRFDAVFGAMSRGGRLDGEKRVDAGRKWALGRVHLGVFQPDRQLAGTGGPTHVLFHGELVNEEKLRSALAEDGDLPVTGAVAIIERL